MNTGMNRIKVPQFKLPEGVKAAIEKRCQWHGIHYGDECQSCIEEKARRKRIMAHRLEEFGLPPEYQAKTFESFIIETPSHKTALDLASGFAQGDIRHLLMIGENGTGKTHLAAGILHTLNKANNFNCLYTTASRMLTDIRACYGATGDAERKALDLFIKPSVLIVDEFDKIKAGEDTKRIISEVIRDRYGYGRQLAIISNGSHVDVQNRMDKSATDRIYESGKMATFDWESWRRRKPA